jgi:hypothetical protein
MFATGTAGPVGLASSEPPLSPETIGRAPSNFDPPVPLVSLEELVGLGKRTATPAPAAPTAVLQRLVLRLTGGEELELGAFADKDAAVARAQEIAALVDEAEERGEWPELDGRLLRPASIVSIDLLVGTSAG